MRRTKARRNVPVGGHEALRIAALMIISLDTLQVGETPEVTSV
jgi:hypothetical protein